MLFLLGFRPTKPKCHREVERASLTQLTFYPDPPAHLLHQILRDGEAEPCAPERTVVGLLSLSEGLKNDFLLFVRDPDSRIT